MNQTELRFDQKTVLITGGGRGLGRAFALELASRGARIALNNRSRDNALATVADIRERGGQAIAIVGDVGEPDEAARCVNEAVHAFGGLDIVINNAGGLGGYSAFQEIPPEMRMKAMRDNLFSAWDVTLAAWPHLMASSGNVLMITSPMSLFNSPNGAHYATAKAGLIGLAKSLAAEGKDAGIRTNLILPIAHTPAAAEMTDDQAQLDYFARVFPAEAVAAGVAWLVHETCDLSGRIIALAGSHAAEIAIAKTSGYTSELDQHTPEVIADHVDAILSRENLSPLLGADEFFSSLTG
jgi:NAD(P)-dependent dehydrogenase (short-subunit alcohol dehydrogenase family)